MDGISQLTPTQMYPSQIAPRSLAASEPEHCTTGKRLYSPLQHFLRFLLSDVQINAPPIPNFSNEINLFSLPIKAGPLGGSKIT